MYAIIADSGRQYRVEEGQELDVDYRDLAKGDEITFDTVLAVSGDDGLKLGTPSVDVPASRRAWSACSKAPRSTCVNCVAARTPAAAPAIANSTHASRSARSKPERVAESARFPMPPRAVWQLVPCGPLSLGRLTDRSHLAGLGKAALRLPAWRPWKAALRWANPLGRVTDLSHPPSVHLPQSPRLSRYSTFPYLLAAVGEARMIFSKTLPDLGY